jgi:hypothetical protein
MIGVCPHFRTPTDIPLLNIENPGSQNWLTIHHATCFESCLDFMIVHGLSLGRSICSGLQCVSGGAGLALPFWTGQINHVHLSNPNVILAIQSSQISQHAGTNEKVHEIGIDYWLITILIGHHWTDLRLQGEIDWLQKNMVSCRFSQIIPMDHGTPVLFPESPPWP